MDIYGSALVTVVMFSGCPLVRPIGPALKEFLEFEFLTKTLLPLDYSKIQMLSVSQYSVHYLQPLAAL